MRPGIARFIKGHQWDLRAADFQHWASSFAISVTMSLSDTERQHASNRRFNATGSTWESMSANAVVQQAKHNSTRVGAGIARAARGGDAGADGAPPSAFVTKPNLTAKASTLARPRTPKGKSALEIFKDDALLRARHSSVKVNPCSKDFWQDLRMKWASMTQGERESYSARSVASKALAHLERKRQSCIPGAVEDALVVAPAAESAGPAMLVAEPSGRPLESPVRVTNVLVGLAELPACPTPDAALATASAALAALTRLPEKSKPRNKPLQPMTSTKLQGFLDMHQDSVTRGSTNFKKRSNVIAQPHEHEIPARVQYPRRCRGLCEIGVPQATLQFQKRFFDLLSKNYGIDAVCANQILVLEVHLSGVSQWTVACMHCESLGRHGRHPAHQSFLMLQMPCDIPLDWNGVVLRAERLPYVRMGPTLFGLFRRFIAGSAGALRILSEEELAEHTFHSVLPAWPEKIVVKEVAYDLLLDDDDAHTSEQFDLSVFITSGCLTAIELTNEDSEEPLPPPLRSPADDPPMPIADAHAAAGDFVDDILISDGMVRYFHETLRRCVPKADRRGVAAVVKLAEEVAMLAPSESASGASSSSRAPAAPAREAPDYAQAARDDAPASDESDGELAEIPEPAAEVVPAEPPAVPAPVALAPGEEALAAPMEMLKLRQMPPHRYPCDLVCDRDGSGKVLARLYLVWGNTWKVVCKCHPRCDVMFSHNWGGKESTLSAALEWATLARSTNEAQHFAEAGRAKARAKAAQLR